MRAHQQARESRRVITWWTSNAADPYWWVDLGPRCEVTELHRVACACRRCRNLPDPPIEMGTTWNEVRP